MSTKSKADKAIGAFDGDCLTLSNQWARVIIAKTRWDDTDKGAVWQWEVTGDIAEFRAPMKAFNTAEQALAYALESLALYEQGACR